MTTIDAADALVILTKIKLYHHPQPDDDATCEAWAEALNYAGITNVRDAVTAVMRHYTTSGANPWITPGDVVAGVRAIRAARIEGLDARDLSPDLDGGTPGGDYADTVRARCLAVMDGMPVAQAIATITGPKSIEARR